MKVLFAATANRHKVGELATLLGPGVRLLSAADAGRSLEIDETASTFEGNAAIKAAAWARSLADGAPPAGVDLVVADDSGLEVDALDGAPGVHSARYAALGSGRTGNSPDPENNAKLLGQLAGVPFERRTARFRCVLAAIPVLPGASEAEHLQAARFFSGSCEGRIAPAASGAGGFGYDPLFIPTGHARSFAELGDVEKGRLSHRAAAVAALRAWLDGTGCAC